ncbi:MAG: TlpA family protein disulfide reductase [Anaerolineae bacterium]|jgi:peroxiredoxin|nr:TlpA family protein disulfide reductase [Anaerolineae bacterium]
MQPISSKPTNLTLILVVAGIVSAIAIFLIYALANPAPAPATTNIGDVAPDFTTTTPTGDPIRLSDFRGQVVFLNFWATWCGPCRIEMPLFQRFYDQTDVTILAVNNRETADQVMTFADQIRITFPLALDESGTIQDQYYVQAYPMTYIIDANGVIVDIHYGVFTPAQMQAAVDEWGG